MFAELSSVVLNHPVQSEGICMPVGARGVVVAVWANGLAYEVEFYDPQHAVITVPDLVLENV